MKGIEKIKSFGLDRADEFTLIHLYLRASNRQKEKLLNYEAPNKVKVRLLSFLLLDSIYYSFFMTLIRVVLLFCIIITLCSAYKDIYPFYSYGAIDYDALLVFVISLVVSCLIMFFVGSYTNKKFEKTYEKICKSHAFNSNLYFKIDKTNISKVIKTQAMASGNGFIIGLANIANEKIKKP